MGIWGTRPWDSDGAADWFGDTMDKTGLAVRVEKALLLDPDDYFEEIRAAAAVLVLLGHNYIWPVNDLVRHLELAASKLEKILENDCYQGQEEFIEPVKAEIVILRSRIGGGKQPEAPDPVKWWRF